MVSKLAVTAIVLLISVPILLGYAMAFEDVEHASYNPTDTKNVTDLIANDSTYSYMSANSYAINSKVWCDYSVNYNPDLVSYSTLYPIYRDISSTYSAVPMARTTMLPSVFAYSNYSYANIRLTDQISADSHMTITIHGGSRDGQSYNTFVGLVYYPSTSQGTIFTYDYNTGRDGSFSATSITSIDISRGSYTGGVQFDYLRADGSSDNTYADITMGYNPYVSDVSVNNTFVTTEWVPSLHSSYILITADLRDLTPWSNGNLVNVGFQLNAWSYGDERNEFYNLAKLQVQQVNGAWAINGTPMYRSDNPDKNVWQFMITNGNIDAAYIGEWPSVMGAAYSYQTISVPFESQAPNDDIQTVSFSKTSPTDNERVRIDAATARSSPYPVIRDLEYSPTMLNASAGGYETTISKIGQSGTSLEFAGNTYAIVNGSITVGSKKLPVEGLTFRSEKQDDNSYVNYIGGVELASPTGSVPTITFNGTWAAIVQTTFMDREITTVTEWIPGEFAWNGADESFALMGLLTCGAVFVGLGMYGRRSGAKVGMLMMITGCAALIFLAMI